MTSQSLSLALGVGPFHDILNHLWQSTLFAALIAVLALAFRNGGARYRFWLWMAASLKFLVPFAALAWIGRNLGVSAAAPETLRWSFLIQDLGSPFTRPPVLTAFAPRPQPVDVEMWVLFVWAAGVAVVLAGWGWRWARLRRTIGEMSPVESGAAFKIVRRLASGPVNLLSSASAMEPGVFGVFRPRLVLPEGVLERLNEAQLEAVIRHELCHIRRRDNLTAAIHMFVQTVFWFHPLVWWLGARLLAERERACDEAVLEQFDEPRAYAQGILKVCEFCLETSVPCVAGVTGADLRRRIEEIMTQRRGSGLTFGRRALLWAAGAAAIGGPVAVGLMDAPRARAQSTAGAPKEFEVASVKTIEPAMGGMQRVEIQMAPGGRFIARGLNLKMMIQQAYGVRDFQIQGAPPWANTDRYEINAKTEGGANIGRNDLGPLLQSLLTERFQLKIRRETKEMPVYPLVVGKGGHKLKESEGSQGDRAMMRRGMLEANGVPMNMFANQLANQLGRAVIDKTGLTGRYDFKLEWTPDESQNALLGPRNPDAPPPPPLDSGGPSIYTAIQEQLGLKLENSRGPVEILVIERVEKPSEN